MILPRYTQANSRNSPGEREKINVRGGKFIICATVHRQCARNTFAGAKFKHDALKICLNTM